jgi:hypothetical protein
MSKVSLRLVLLVAACWFTCAPAVAQRRGPFQGDWEWVVYAKNRKELPPAYRDAPIRSVPAAGLYLKLRQRGNKLTGEYSGSSRYLAKLEDGELDASIKGETAILELTSGFGGTVTAQISISGKLLHWRVVKSDGEPAYFPYDVFLHRIRPRKHINFEER